MANTKKNTTKSNKSTLSAEKSGKVSVAKKQTSKKTNQTQTSKTAKVNTELNKDLLVDSFIKTNKKPEGKQIKSPRILTKEDLGIKEPKPKKIKKSKKTLIETAKRFSPDAKKGLTSKQVEERTLAGLTNKSENKNTKTYKNIFFSNICTFFNLLCFTVAGALIAVNAWNNLLFMAIFMTNIVIGIFQEIKAKRTIEKISLVTAPTCCVIRDGIKQDISVSEVVLDDVVLFLLGKQIPADCIVLDGEVDVNESMLTGESVPVKKRKGDLLYSGSFITSGKCTAQVEKVGDENYSVKLANQAKQYKKPKSELLHSLKVIITLIGIAILPLSILMFNNNFIQLNSNLPETVKKTAGSIIGMIPAGMFLLTSMALAVGVIKLAKKRTLVQDLYSIEMLARTDVLCLDKTGTITDGTMKVNSVIQLSKQLNYKIGDIMGSMLTALDSNDPTSRALASHFGYSRELTKIATIPFSSSRKLSAVSFKQGGTYIMGAPEYVYKTKNIEIDRQVKSFAQRGLRVLMLAKSAGTIEGDKLPKDCSPLALLVIEDHIREDASKTIKWFKENGVQIKIISGDNPITVSEVSKRVGVEFAENFISLEGLSEQQVVQAASKYTVFGRVSPEQKCILIKTLKSKGHKVAMTGDGVNDILALKEADCSIAMASGSEAARSVSHLVLLDSNFGSMPDVVAEGRRVVNNVQKSSSLFLMKTLFTILISIFCLCAKIEYPFTTNQMLLLEFCVIGIPSLFLSMQPNSEKIRGRFLPNVISKSVPGAILFTLMVIACYLINLFVPSVTVAEYQTMAAICVIFTGMLILLRLCQPFDLFRGILFTACAIISLVLLSLLYDFFEYASLNLQNILFAIVLIESSYPVYNVIIKVIDKIRFWTPGSNQGG